MEQLDGDIFGRIHAQTAKQLVRQRLREVEREQVFGQYASASRRSSPARSAASSRGRHPRRRPGARRSSPRPTSARRALPHRPARQGVRARGSAHHQGSADLRQPHPQELPAPPLRARGARDPRRHGRDQGDRPRGGHARKVAVSSRQEGLDPVGATVGQRGGRVQAVVAELGGEKIDVIPWNEDPASSWPTP